MGATLLKYSNGWGHLIMSIALLATAIVLIFQHDQTLTGVATGLILSVAGYWIATSAANSQKNTTAPAPAAPPVMLPAQIPTNAPADNTNAPAA